MRNKVLFFKVGTSACRGGPNEDSEWPLESVA